MSQPYPIPALAGVDPLGREFGDLALVVEKEAKETIALAGHRIEDHTTDRLSSALDVEALYVVFRQESEFLRRRELLLQVLARHLVAS